MKELKKIAITMGLPASGKTTFARKYIKENYNDSYSRKKRNLVYNFNVDSYVKKYGNGNDVSKLIASKLFSIGSSYQEVVIDALFLTNEDIVNLLSNACEFFEDLELNIHFWEEDRETCLYNDMYRREENSTAVIQNATLEEPNVDYIKERIEQLSKVNVFKHKVVKKPKWQLALDRAGLETDEYGVLWSEEWCIGGVWGSYTGASGEVSADSPLEFTELDNLLEYLCPTITFLQYKALYRECVSYGERHQSDYYGGYTDYAYYYCDMSKLYDYLIDNRFIKEEED